jgi:hypothetical protein
MKGIAEDEWQGPRGECGSGLSASLLGVSGNSAAWYAHSVSPFGEDQASKMSRFHSACVRTGLRAAVLIGMVFACLFAMKGGVQRVAMRDVRVVRGLLMVSSLVMFRGFAMVVRSVFVMIRGGSVMLGAFM